MSKRFPTEADINEFLATPRLAILMYQRSVTAPTGVPVWFDWDGATLRLFSGRSSPKVQRLQESPTASVLVTNHVGEPEGWVAFDGEIVVSEFERSDWESLIDRVAPRYWDLSDEGYADEIAGWRSSPESFAALTMTPERIRSGA